MHLAPDEVKQLYEKIQQVHQLVALSQGAKDYIDFEPNEFAFDELVKHIRNKPQAEAESVRSTYFLGTLANVTYRKLRNLRRSDASQIVQRELDGDLSLKPLLDAVSANPTGTRLTTL